MRKSISPDIICLLFLKFLAAPSRSLSLCLPLSVSLSSSLSAFLNIPRKSGVCIPLFWLLHDHMKLLPSLRVLCIPYNHISVSLPLSLSLSLSLSLTVCLCLCVSLSVSLSVSVPLCLCLLLSLSLSLASRLSDQQRSRGWSGKRPKFRRHEFVSFRSFAAARW